MVVEAGTAEESHSSQQCSAGMQDSAHLDLIAGLIRQKAKNSAGLQESCSGFLCASSFYCSKIFLGVPKSDHRKSGGYQYEMCLLLPLLELKEKYLSYLNKNMSGH